MTEQTTTEWASTRDAVPDWYFQQTVYDEATGDRIATVFDARAHSLILAAPAMLEALRAAAAHWDYTDSPTGALCRAAIATATGEV